MKKEIVRVLRVLEYVGDRKFVESCLEQRQVKGKKQISKDCYIVEAILGETYEVLSPAPPDMPPFERAIDALLEMGWKMESALELLKGY